MRTQKTIVMNVVGLTRELLGREMPNLSEWARRGATATIEEVTPAVTCSAQATYLTGRRPDSHGIVGNGWYSRDEGEVKFWKQSNRLVGGAKIWEMARVIDHDFTCANLFWWFNMNSSVDVAVTPRPMYPADGRKIPDVHTRPAELRGDLQKRFGTFPLFDFWGPKASIASSRWIADAARYVETMYDPTLTLIYLPHLDYNLQRLGPSDPAIASDLRDIDRLCGELIRFYEEQGAQVIVLSEYGITDVSRPVHINRVLRSHGYITVRDELGREILDPGESRAFAVADHQIAHIYVNDRNRLHEVRRLLESVEGIDEILCDEGRKRYGLDHERAGDIVAIASPDAWFTYYYWLEDECAPDFARTVDIHRKPGYDPAELFIDPSISLPKLSIGWKLLKKKLGLRTLLDVIPLDASLVKGSHGRPAGSPSRAPLFITQRSELLGSRAIEATDVCSLILHHLCDERRLVDDLLMAYGLGTDARTSGQIHVPVPGLRLSDN